MPTYDLSCEQGHRAEVSQSFYDELPACPVCGSAMTKLLTGFAIQGQAKLPPRPEAMPQTWRGTYHGNREYLTELRHTVDARQKLEERHPELAGDRRPILAHEGRFASQPLRAGDTPATRLGDSHGHGHGHAHHHPHDHGAHQVGSQRGGSDPLAPS